MLKRLRTAHTILYCVLSEVLFLGSMVVFSLLATIVLAAAGADFDTSPRRWSVAAGACAARWRPSCWQRQARTMTPGTAICLALCRKLSGWRWHFCC